MWMIQICLASFWWYIGILLLFRGASAWEVVREISWFRSAFHSSASRKWERFCRDAGLICFVTSCLLFLNLPYGMAAFGIIIALPPLLFFL